MKLNLIQNYIYLHHLDKFYILPTYPESVQNSIGASFAATTPLLRTAPIQSYTSSGPRQVSLSFNLHRDLMNSINYTNNTLNVDLTEDYVDVLIRDLQAVALPRYAATTKMIDPPQVTVRIGNDIYIKGIISGQISTGLSGPIMEDDKYSEATISFSVVELDPYDAETIQIGGLFSGVNKTLEKAIWR